jgi:dipeptidyl aminopeptidase/acylaminoacyl peptidase
VAPTSAAPKGGRTVVTWAHGTVGLADQCAPSKAADAATKIPFVGPLVDHGYVVVATDYEGLGTPGTHPYLVGESEGRSVLDAARAAQALKATAAKNDVLVAGHSQGGQAALFAGELASSYAPDLQVLGVAAAAPAADVEHILPLAGAILGGAGYLAMGIEGFHAAYPQADPAAVLSAEALAKASAATTECSDTVHDVYSTVSGSVLAHDPLSIPAFQKLLHQNSAGNRPAGAPLLIVQGTADTTIPKTLSDAFTKKACAAGDTVDYRTYEGAGHGSVVVAAHDDVIAWLADRAAGKPAPSTCS